jgi:deoxyribose-phosphate aldolase
MAELVKIDEITPMQVANICDHTFLDTTESYKYKIPGCDPITKRADDFFSFLEKSIYGELKFAAVCVRGSDAREARDFLRENKSDLVLAVTTGFPDGRIPLNQKKYETMAALENGADEIDFVINWAKLKQGDSNYIQREMNVIQDLVNGYHKKSKAILETAMLTNEEVLKASELAEIAGIDFIKTSTGYSGGATPEVVALMKEDFAGGVKASGGITTKNIKPILQALSGRKDGYIELDSERIRIGEGSLFKGMRGVGTSY